jgi:putative peptidoglycan lipid II flippase
MTVLFGHGAFDATSALLSAQALAAYALGLPAFVLLKVLVPAFFAHSDTSTPVRVGFIAITLNLALNLVFMVPLQHVGPALATSVSAIFNVVTLSILLARRGHLAIDPRLRRRLLRMVAAAGAMAAALVYGQGWLTPYLAGPWRWLALAVLVGGGSLVYLAAAQLFGAFDMRELRAMIRRRRTG